MSMSKVSDSAMGAYLALVETTGLGVFGFDHYLMSIEAKRHGDDEHSQTQYKYFLGKLSLLLGAVCVFYTFRELIKLPYEDPLYVFPLLILIAWIMWAVHDILWVVIGTLLDYPYIFNIDTSKWGEYRSFQKLVVCSMLIILAITGWHFAWYFANPDQH